MKLSIITINYNNKKGLENTIKSVIYQTFRDYEYIIIDGGSTDGSKDVIESFVRDSNSNISFWCSEHDNGIYNAMNKGIAHANGEYLNFMNSGDTFASPQSLELATKYNWNTDVIMGDVFLYTPYSRWYDYVQAPDKLGFQRLMKYGLFHQSAFIKKDLFDDSRYDESYRIISDWAFWFDKLIIEGKTYKHIPLPICTYESGGISCDGKNLWKERRNHLQKYYNPKLIERVLEDLEWEKDIEYKYILSGERKVLKNIISLVDSVYAKFIVPIIKRYMAMKYINHEWDKNIK